MTVCQKALVMWLSVTLTLVTASEVISSHTNITVTRVRPSGSNSTAGSLVSGEVLYVIEWLFYAVLTEAVDIFGAVTNIINIVCFVKQGFKDAVNISLLGLAVSDLGCLLTLMWTNICYNPAFRELDLPFEPIEFQYLTGAWPHVLFTRVTSWITAFITLERCLCITMPLKVKAMFPRRQVTCIIICIFVGLAITFIPMFCVNQLTWKFSPTRNKTLIGLVFTKDREIVEAVVFAFSNVFVQFSAFLTVLVCTVTLVVKLRAKSKWRQESAAPGQAEAASGRDQKVTKMVIVISSLFIICFVPICMIIVGMIVEPEFSIGGKYRNMFILVCGIGFALESTNSATNIFIYYHMSSKYKTVFLQLFGKLTLRVPCRTSMK